MKVKDLLNIQEVLEKRKTPCDLHEEANLLNQHFSRSKNEYMDILDMDLIHLIRSYSKCLGEGYEYIDVNNKEKIREHLDKILSETYNTRELLGD